MAFPSSAPVHGRHCLDRGPQGPGAEDRPPTPNTSTPEKAEGRVRLKVSTETERFRERGIQRE